MLGAYNGVILQPMFPNQWTCRARIGSSFTLADLLHDFSGPANRRDKSQRVNRPLGSNNIRIQVFYFALDAIYCLNAYREIPQYGYY